ncbi:hypothetical protein [Natrarchaeobaculum sulfurireducens]|uniref:DUF7960 domain-containing protein n=1 Tax=Natrarchaeobaculum sulfurireducens TaxID=2044521 RepID=A0A346PUA4_9EURY|nr:hypothetical protein [Natrarchaeobaculum sulfurireducens]AXR83099.1 hypothetical protein AArcMg_3112 [Natrarchaeobaculum sulfurireducens]
MYTGKTEKPCCLCDAPKVDHRIDLPPRAIQQLKHGDAIAWQDVVGEVSIYFCEHDWETVCDLVLETGMTPLPRCNVARASFDLREDFEAFTGRTREEPNQDPIEERFWRESKRVLGGNTEYPPSDRDLVQAHVVSWALSDLEASVAESGAEPTSGE